LLSVVAASRNDDHGLHLLPRTQVFIDGLADQAERFARPIELIIVDWNPPSDAKPLSDALIAPESEFFGARVITVPHSVHSRLAGSAQLDFYQMIAKNVGIRRASGDAVLSTNIDIVLSDRLFLKSTRPLMDRHLYRADRADIPFDPIVTTDPRVLRESEPIRINRKNGIYYRDCGRTYPHVRGPVDLASVFIRNPVDFIRRATRWSPNSGSPSVDRYRRAFLQILALPRLHLNACGDFTLMTSRSWAQLRGYPEWEMFSWNIDSLLLYQAAAAGFEFVEFDGHPAFHLEHSAGWSPESHAELFARLESKSVPLLSDAGLLDVASSIWRTRSRRRWLINTLDWGIPNVDFAEAPLRRRKLSSLPSPSTS
jgi:hypothetical protein